MTGSTFGPTITMPIERTAKEPCAMCGQKTRIRIGEKLMCVHCDGVCPRDPKLCKACKQGERWLGIKL